MNGYYSGQVRWNDDYLIITFSQSAVVEVLNLSDLPAKVALKYQSKVVTFRQSYALIAPRQSADLKMDFVPRKINPDYRYE